MSDLVTENSLVRQDSFISPAIIKGITDEVHFFCLQDDTEPGLDEDLLARHQACEIRHDTIEGLIRALERLDRALIMDLDLDLFNRDTPFYAEGAELPKSITGFLDGIRDLFLRAQVITIAKSPGHWWIRNEKRWDWDTDLSEELARIVIPYIFAIRSL